MRLLELRLDGFGRLVDRVFEFGRGLNLVYGPNESGKSTLQQAILTMLYGFYDSGRISEAKRAHQAAYQPWDSRAAYRGSLVYTLDDGRTYQVRRTIAPRGSVQIFSYHDGQEVTQEFKQDSHARLYFADAQLGMDKAVFEAACTVRQGQLIALDTSASAITETLTRLSASASADTAASDALAILQSAMKDKVGSLRSWTKPLPQALQRLKTLEDDRHETDAARREAFTQVLLQQRAEADLEELESERERVKHLRLMAQVAEIRHQWESIEQAQLEIERLSDEVKRWQLWADFPVAQRDVVTGLASKREALQTELTSREPSARQAQRELDQLLERARSVNRQVEALSDARTVKTEHLPRINKFASEWRLADQAAKSAEERRQRALAGLAETKRNYDAGKLALGQIATSGHAGLAELQQRLSSVRQRLAEAEARLEFAEAAWERVGWTESDFLELEQKVEGIRSGRIPSPKPRKGCFSSLLGSGGSAKEQPPTELVIYADIHPIYTARAQANAELEDVRSTVEQTEALISAQLGTLAELPLKETSFATVRKKLDELAQVSAALQQQHQALLSLKSEALTAKQESTAAHSRLLAELASLGFTQRDPEEALQAYTDRCERKTLLERAEAEQKQIDLGIQALKRDVQIYEEKKDALNSVQGELCSVLAKASVSCTPESVDEGLVGFSLGLKNQAKWSEARAAWETATRQIATLSDEASRQQQESAVMELQDAIKEGLHKHPEWKGLQPEASVREYTQILQQSESQWASTQNECQRIREGLKRTSEDLRHPAEIAEEMLATRTRVQRLERFRDALELACTELESATREFQKQFAPKLEQSMRKGLRNITSERYSHVRVDPVSLDVSLVAPETQDEVSVEHLSTGTRDLVYMLLRVGLAQLLSSTGERLPLLLDDPMVQFDRERQTAAMRFLAELGADSQVLLVTKDSSVVEWFEHEYSGSAHHRLHML